MVGHAGSSRSRCAPRHWPWPIFFFLPGARRRAERPTGTSSIVCSIYTPAEKLFHSLPDNKREKGKKESLLAFREARTAGQQGSPYRARELIHSQKVPFPVPVSRSPSSWGLVAGLARSEERGSRISPCDLQVRVSSSISLSWMLLLVDLHRVHTTSPCDALSSSRSSYELLDPPQSVDLSRFSRRHPPDPLSSSPANVASMSAAPTRDQTSSNFHNGSGRGFLVSRRAPRPRRLWLRYDPALDDWVG